MKKMFIVASLCAASASAYAGDDVDQSAAMKANTLTQQQTARQSSLQMLPLEITNAAAAKNLILSDAPRFGDQPITTRIVGHEEIEVGGQKVALSISEEKYSAGYVSECKQYIKSYEHHIVAESDAWGGANLPSDETTIRLGNRCGRPKKD